MEEIKVGEYVRLSDGLIGKVVEIYVNNGLKIKIDEESTWKCAEDNIKKHSPNIIDLIEVGDILEIEEDGIRGYIGWKKDTTTLSYKDMLEDIKKGEVKLLGIVTHEQFNSIKYEVI